MIYFLGIGLLGALMLALSLFGFEGDGDLGGDGGGFFDLKVISTSLLGLGLAGAISAQSLGLGFELLTFVIGLAGGAVTGMGTYQFLKLVYRQQATSLYSLEDFLGAEAQVSIAIPVDGVGQIACEVNSTRVYREARSKDNKPMGVGDRVYISGFEGGVVIVEQWDVLESGIEQS